MTTHSNPAGAPAPMGLYSNLARAGDLLFVAGQVGVREDGSLAGEDLLSQAKQTFENIGAILESEGAGFRDVLKFTTYLVGSDRIGDFVAARKEIFRTLYPDGSYPANTLLVIDGLVRPEFVVEIEAVAHVGDRAVG
jgi:enamine deaminase RidA (YjgF/YER057c/UK114 family)